MGQLAPEATGEAVLIFAVTGMGGIGKTALVVEAAHRGRGRGWFPGGTLFVDLRGYDDNPVTADQAVLALLDALGVQGPELPSTAARQYDVYRVLLTERRDRTLLILDNASDPAQFLELLPGTDQHRVLITSRDRPDSLPVRLIDLETLDPEESVALVKRALHEADERDDRPAREPEALHELASLCGHLPLALQIAAAMLRRRRLRSIAGLVTEIQDAGDPAAVLDNGSPGTDLYGRSLVLRPVLETSYRRLGAEQARLLRLLCLAPGADCGTEALAALADREEGVVVRLLEDLAAASLVSPVHSGERWRVHDLVRAFGVGVVSEEEGEAGRGRLLEFYLRWADAAEDRLRWLPGRPEPERFADRAQALAWLDSEQTALVAAAQWAAEERHADAAMRLALRLEAFLEWRRHFADWITVARAAQEAAHRTKDPRTEAEAWNSLGFALRLVGRVDSAREAHTHARGLSQAIEDRHGEADAWHNLGIALRAAGQVEEAIEAHTRSIDLYQEIGRGNQEGAAWNNLGIALQDADRTDDAIDALSRALDLHQTARDRHREGTAWHNLGISLRRAGRFDEAVEAFGKDLEICREVEDWYGEGQTLFNLAFAYEDTHHTVEARTHYLQAADAYTKANAPTEAAEAQSSADALT
ncbi:tetratricopeptide repeat protein [Streptomyces sp. NPDC003635]